MPSSAQDKVDEITITNAPDAWEAMQVNLVELVGEPGTRGPGADAPGRMMPPPGGTPLADIPDGGPDDFTVENPL